MHMQQKFKDFQKYNLSKCLQNILINILHKNKFYIKDSQNFANFNKTPNISNQHIFISVDVISMNTVFLQYFYKMF